MNIMNAYKSYNMNQCGKDSVTRHISADLGAPDVQFVWDQEDGKNEAQDRYQRLGIEGHDWQILGVF